MESNKMRGCSSSKGDGKAPGSFQRVTILQNLVIKEAQAYKYFNFKKHLSLNIRKQFVEVYSADGFVYKKYRCNKQKTLLFLKCRNEECNGKAIITNKQLRLTAIHNHPRKPEELMDLKVLDAVQKIIRNGCYGAQRAYDIVMHRKPELRRFASFDFLIGPIHRLILNEKQVTSVANGNIFGFCEFLIERYDKYEESFSAFILDKEKNTCSIIFVDETVCTETSSAELLIDCSFQANFKNAETYFLNINLKSDSYNGPCFFALMNSFTEEEITKVLTLFRDHISNNMAVLKILSDNNENLISSVTKVYSFAVINCSLFHYILNIFKKLNRNGYEFKSKISMQLFNYLCAIPLLPPNLIKEALIYIEEESIRFNQSDNFIQVLTYVRQYFIIQITPQMLSNYSQVAWINEDISNVYKAFYNYLDVESEYEYIQFTDKLMNLQKYFSTSNKENNVTGFSNNSSKLKRTLEILWEIKDVKFEEFFKISLPIVTSMLKLLKIWGYSKKKDLDELILFNQSMLDNQTNME